MAIYRGPGGSGDATTDAANQASVATAKAAEATTSANAAASSATSADNSATASSTSASNSATSATASASSATASASSATAAASSATAAAASFDSFDDRYLGAKSSAPTTDNDGNALAEGAMYYDTGDDIIYVWNGTTWQTITTGSGGLQAANNLSDVNSASASRTNLGLAIGSDVQAFSSVLAGTTASYTTAEETKLAGIETGATADQTAAQIKTAYESNADTNAFTDADHTKLDGIEVSADVTGTTNVTAAGALMDSELTSEASVKALNQGVATTDSPSFAGLTVDTDTLAVDSTNNRVGIGTTSPANKLEVTGAIVAQGAVTAYTNTGLYLQNKGSSVVDVGAWRSGASVAELSFSTDSGSDAAPVERMRIDSSGDVGIGTSSPAKNLHVSSTGSPTFRIQDTDGSDYYAEIQQASGNTIFSSRFGASNGAFVFRGLGGGTADEHMRIDSSGNVGIGTTNPNYLLDIEAGALGETSGDTVNLLELKHTNTNNSYLRFEGLRTATGTDWNNAGTRIQQAIDSTDMAYIQFNGDDNNVGITFGKGSSTEHMRINSSGDVGIGTTSPAATVDVSGNARGAVVTDNDLSFDLSASNNFNCTPTGGGTLTFTNHLAGQSGFVWLDNSGGHAIAAAGTTKINAADLTAISTAGVYTLAYFDNGTNAYVSVSRSFA